jgi:hypothetical protein
MDNRSFLRAMTLTIAFCTALESAQAFDDQKFPDWQGQWVRIGGAQWDNSKPEGLGQQAPLTLEYQAKFAAGVANQEAGGQGDNLMARCFPAGMPRMMLGYNQFEFLIFPDTTYIINEHFGELRRAYTDGRTPPEKIKSTFAGYSIGKWVDENGDGRYDALVIETRNIGGPRTFDSSGLPLHQDDRTIVKEYIHLDRNNADILRNEITTIDHALTRPWTVTRSYQHRREAKWFEHPCENAYSQHLFIGGENYFLSADGRLMPARKGQGAPDLRYFDPPQ